MNTLRIILLSFVACFLALAFTGLAAAQNPLLETLLRDGVPVGPKEVVALPRPSLADGLSAKEQRKVIESITGEKYSWDAFTRKAVVTPFVVKISDNDAANARVGRRIDLWFVAYGDLKTVQADETLTSRFQGSGGGGDDNAAQVKMLSNAELVARRLKVPETEADPRYIAADVTLFEKVRLNATTRNVKTATADSVIVASVLDQGFNDDPEFPNRWRSIGRDAGGKKQFGEPQRYFGIGSYVKATALAEPVGALFVEYHAAFAEPEGWFQGANLLRSKLPIAAQDNVRRFRRSLTEK